MKILVTGGAGFLGSHMAEHLLRDGHEVLILDTASDVKLRHLKQYGEMKYVQASILEPEILENLVRKADMVYHFAAVVGVEHYVADPYSVLNVNVNGTQNVLKLAHRYDKKVVFASTSEVYGRNPKIPWKEVDERVLGSTEIDRWCYSTSKAVGEHFCFAYKKMGLPIVIVRYFNVYGPRLDKLDVGRVITIFLGQIIRNEPITVIGNGKQTRCFTYVDDAVRATIAAGTNEAALGGIFNIGNPTETTVLELAETLRDVAGSKVPIVHVDQKQVYGESYEDVPRRVPDVTRMNEILKLRCDTPLREGLAHTVEWFRSQTRK